ncbi:hypothetical protein EAX61_13730 [Dokdonia sinensis]|uniref:EF-hand domain-containing protein n=1 Tax=Dokdonia sinensis TaxID=2479847 RepID=A0A3M0FVG0_9FLAO|nr:hypothetical protein [Dokdonia sinensis]RMB56661.1 hypothetical protein EAX61_13730 [Dokdonia sinensis]
MKTVITLCIALAVSICTAQEPAKINENLLSPEQVEQLKETLTSIAQKLDSNKDTFFSKEEVQLLMQKLESTQEQQAQSTVFSKTYRTDSSPTSHTEVKYSVTLNDKEDLAGIEDLKNLDLSELSSTMADFVTALLQSPKIKELAVSLQQLQEKLENAKKD